MAIYSGFTHWKWWFSIAMLVYQRVIGLQIWSFLNLWIQGIRKKPVPHVFFLIILKQSEVDETQTSPDSEVNISACASIWRALLRGSTYTYNSHMYIHTCVYIYMSCHAMWCDAMLCSVMSCDGMLCHVMSRHVHTYIYIYVYIIQLCSMGLSKHGFDHWNHNFGMRSISGHIQMNSVQNLAILCWLVNQSFHSGTKKPGVKLSTMWVLFVGYCWFMLVYNHYEALRYIYHNTMH